MSTILCYIGFAYAMLAHFAAIWIKDQNPGTDYSHTCYRALIAAAIFLVGAQL